MAGAGARAHAERFLAACPEDVREAAKATPVHNNYSLFWGRHDRYVNLIFRNDGCVSRFDEGQNWDYAIPIDRLLGGA